MKKMIDLLEASVGPGKSDPPPSHLDPDQLFPSQICSTPPPPFPTLSSHQAMTSQTVLMLRKLHQQHRKELQPETTSLLTSRTGNSHSHHSSLPPSLLFHRNVPPSVVLVLPSPVATSHSTRAPSLYSLTYIALVTPKISI